MEIFERADVLRRMAAAMSGWPEGGGSAVLISGEAGIGKTTVADAFLREVRDVRRVYRGYCDMGTGVRAFGPFLDFAEAFDSRLLPLLGSATGFREHLPAVLEMLRSRPAIIVIEDIHNADDASLALVHFMLRRLRDLPLFLIATFRENEVSPDHPFSGILGSVAADMRLHHLRLARLSQAAIAAAAGVEEGDPVARTLHLRSGGNPFLLRALLGHQTGEVPPSFRDLVRAKLAGVTDGTRGFILAAALQRTLDPAVLRLLFGDWSGHEIEGLRAGLLERRGPELAFPHELTREAVLAQAGAHDVRDWHGKILDALITDGARDPSRLAHHAIGAARRTETRTWALAAAQAALARDALREAAHYAASALDLVRGQDHETAELLEVQAAVRASTGRLADCLDDLTDATAIWRTIGHPDRAAACLARTAMPLVRLGRNREADEAAAAAVATLQAQGESALLAASLAKTAYLAMLDRDNARCLHFGNRAIAMADRLGPRVVLAEALMVVGTSLVVSDDPAGQPLVERAIAIAISERQSELVARCHANLGSGYGEQMRFAQARPFLEEGLRYAEARDLDEVATYMRAWMSLINLGTGQLWAARERAQALLAAPNVTSMSRIMGLVAFGRASVRLGLADGTAALETALELARATGTLQRIAPACLAAAEAALQSGDLERAQALAREVHDIAIAHRHAWFTGEAQLVLLRTGAEPPPTPWIAPPLRQEISGDARGAAHNWEARGCPFEQARALAYGDTEARREALLIYDRIGARPAADSLRRELRRDGVRGLPMGARRRLPQGPSGMTPRQMEVARLLCEGLTDSEIAERLKVSPKTVGHHVSAVLAKLDVPGRHHVMRALSAGGKP